MTLIPALPDTRKPPPLPRGVHTPSEAPLTGEHLDQLTYAKLRAKKVRKACGVATLNGCILVAFSGLSLLMALIGLMFGEFDVLGLGFGAGLGILAWNEFRGRAMLRGFKLRGCQVLGWNQVGLLAMVIVYSVWMIAAALWGPSPYDEAIANESMLAGPLGSINELHKMITVAIYGGLIVGTLIFQGLNVLYYFTRRTHVEAYLRETPEWVVELQRRGVA
ncbi:MAG: hypothetical protein QGH60_02830 [Phycisphaerae bacterium]|nr:hypothetical protein [Phycisphaerae bacterium]